MILYYGSILQARSFIGDIDKQVGNKLYQIATRFKGTDERLMLLVGYVCDGRLNTELQMAGRRGIWLHLIISSYRYICSGV